MRRLLRLALVLATLGAIAYLATKRPTPAPAPAPRPTPAPKKPPSAPVAMKVEPQVAEVGDLDVHGEPELDTLTDRSESVSDTDVVLPAKQAPAKKKAAAKKAPAKKKAAAKKAPAKKAVAKKAAPPADPPIS